MATPPAPGLRRELARKTFHVASVVLPLAAWHLPRRTGVTLLASLAVIALLVELARFRLRGPRYYFLRYTRPMLRGRERRGLSGATHMALAYAAAIALFPVPIAVAGMLYNALGDTAAALAGKRFGRHRTAWGKSWEGFAAALVVCLTIGLLLPGFPLPAALLGALAAATLEFLPIPVDDNLRVTLGGAAFAWLGALIA
jgi:dolichol kinase